MVFSSNSFRNQFALYNRNIRLAMISALFVSIGQGVMMGTVFSVFVKILGGTDEALGLISTFGGIFTTFTLVPAGIIADRIRNRRLMLQVGAIFIGVGFFFFIFAGDITWLFFGQGLVGFAQGLTQPPLNAIVADSMPSGGRDKVYAQLFFIRSGLNCFGPFLAALLFLVLGNNWGVDILREVLIVGAIIMLTGSVIQVLMHDKYSLGNESESLLQQHNETNNLKTEKNLSLIQTIAIPLSLVTLGTIIGLGAGMTVRFFPIFFKEIYLLSPVTTNIIFGIGFLLTGVFSLITPKIARYIGKIETIFLVQMLAILCLLLIAEVPPLAFVVPAYILRGAFMNSTPPLNYAIIMDRVPKRHRGKWNALEGVTNGFLWSLSAVIGGILLDQSCYPFLYHITASLYIIATLPLLFLRRYVKEKPINTGKTKILNNDREKETDIVMNV